MTPTFSFQEVIFKQNIFSSLMTPTFSFQEVIFTLPGFSGYGWYLTLIQFFYYTIFGKVSGFVIIRSGKFIIHFKVLVLFLFVLYNRAV
jgi:hypothetical protein